MSVVSQSLIISPVTSLSNLSSLPSNILPLLPLQRKKGTGPP